MGEQRVRKSSLLQRVRGAVALATVGAAIVTGAPAAAADSGQDPDRGPARDLVEHVEQAARDRVAREPASTYPEARVTVLRRDRNQEAFGTVVLVAPRHADALPRDWLFVAERDGAGWRVGLDGQPAFAELAARSSVLSPRERTVFAAHDGRQPRTTVNGDYRTGMRLPWAVGQSWRIRGGPHAYDAGSGPWSSVDLVGGDQRVLAVRDGLAYTPCVGMIRILHPDGYASRYYHLWNHIWADGRSVSAGTYLGLTGTETGCGGAASSRHVHFSLMYNGEFVAIANHIIGKWLFRDGPAQYSGSALHGSRSVPVGGTIHNYGALGRTQGIVDTDGGSTLNRRSGPGTGHPVVGSVTDGTTVDISCSATGTTHTGRWGSTSMWNRLTDGGWVSDAYVYTGIDGPVNGWC